MRESYDTSATSCGIPDARSYVLVESIGTSGKEAEKVVKRSSEASGSSGFRPLLGCHPTAALSVFCPSAVVQQTVSILAYMRLFGHSSVFTLLVARSQHRSPFVEEPRLWATALRASQRAEFSDDH